MRKTVLALILGTLYMATAHGAAVSVTMEGVVIFNAIGAPPLANVAPGGTAVMSFEVDSNNFVDGVPGDTRGYVIDASSFSLEFPLNGVTVGLADPFPGTPYFTLIDGFPVSDGFFVSDSPISPGGAALSQAPYQVNFDVGYMGDTLSSLDILEAVGTYDFTGLTRFAFDLWDITPDFPRLSMDFTEMTIVPEPSPSLLAIVLAALLIRRR